MEKLYKFDFYSYRDGTIDGLFVAEEAVVEAAIGREVYLGEVMGKHSEVCGTLENKHLTVVSDDPDFVNQFKNLEVRVGYNPLEHLED